MKTDFNIGASCVTLVYDKYKDSDTYEVWGANVVEQGWVTELTHVLFKGKPVSLSYEWEEKAKQYIENL